LDHGANRVSSDLVDPRIDRRRVEDDQVRLKSDSDTTESVSSTETGGGVRCGPDEGFLRGELSERAGSGENERERLDHRGARIVVGGNEERDAAFDETTGGCRRAPEKKLIGVWMILALATPAVAETRAFEISAGWSSFKLNDATGVVQDEVENLPFGFHLGGVIRIKEHFGIAFGYGWKRDEYTGQVEHDEWRFVRYTVTTRSVGIDEEDSDTSTRFVVAGVVYLGER
jgi:hypothetical protein